MADGQLDGITARTVAQAAHAGDPLALQLVHQAGDALAAGLVGLINVLNPCRVILGGGVMKGMPELLAQVDRSVRRRALAAATANLEIIPAKLQDDAGVIGAAALALDGAELRGHRD